MVWQKINIQKYVAEVKSNLDIDVSDDIIIKDLLLTLILAEFEKEPVFKKLIFKGGTLLSRNYLNYHRFSEDLDFVYADSNTLRTFSRNDCERKIKIFIDVFVPKLKRAADELGLDFSANRSDKKYCTILSGRVVYIFRLYYETNHCVKIEVNFIEKVFFAPKKISVQCLTDFFDSKELSFTLGLNILNFRTLSYSLDEVILEKYRAVLTRPSLMDRDLFDLFLIKNSLNVDINKVVDKIRASELIKKRLSKLISEKLSLLEKNEYLSDEKIEDLAITKYDSKSFEEFKRKIRPLLIKICSTYLQEQGQ